MKMEIIELDGDCKPVDRRPANSITHGLSDVFLPKETKTKKYSIVVMELNGRTTVGREYDSIDEVRNAMLELRTLYAKNEVYHHVGYMEV